MNGEIINSLKNEMERKFEIPELKFDFDEISGERRGSVGLPGFRIDEKNKITFEPDAEDIFDLDELKGYTASGIGIIKSRNLGYIKEIDKSIVSVSYNIPELYSSGTLGALRLSLQRSSGTQLAIDAGYADHLLAYEKKSDEFGKRAFEKSGNIEVVDGKNFTGDVTLLNRNISLKLDKYEEFLGEEDHLNGLIMDISSPPFYLSGLTEFGKKIDYSIKDVFIAKKAKKFVHLYEKVRDAISVKNPPSEKVIMERAKDLLKIYASM